MNSELRVSQNLESGPRHWRSLTELIDPTAFQAYLTRAETALAPDWNAATRRDFLRLLSASLALAGISGCGRQPAETIVPYVRQPEGLVPGNSLYYATAMTFGGIAMGLLVESHMGRPTKIEGNPRHPSVPATYWTGDPDRAPGVSDAFAQAAILTLYDPDRSQTITRGGEISTWDAFVSALKPQLEAQRDSRGRGTRVLTETVSSPALADQIRRFLEAYPEAQWIQFEPVNDDNSRAGSQLAFGRYVDTHYNLAAADVILSLDADFLIDGPDHLRHAFEFAQRREARTNADAIAQMSRLYVLESTPSLTGAKADHRLPLPTDEIEAFALALAARLGIDIPGARDSPISDQSRRWLGPVVDDLRNYRRQGNAGSAVVLAGRWLSPRAHGAVHAINAALGAVGKTVRYTEPVAAAPSIQYDALAELVDDMRSGRVELLFVLDGNPAYASPAELDFAKALAKVPFRVRLGLYEDETSVLCDWHVPLAHFLESWSDARAADGSVCIAQPLIAPLYQGKTACEIMAVLLDEPGKSAHAIVKDYWQTIRSGDGGFETFWQTSLHDGVMADTRSADVSATVDLSKLSTPPDGAIRRDCARQKCRRSGAGRHCSSPRSDDMGRTLCQQWLAAGVAEAAHEADLGQRGAGEPANGRTAGTVKRGRGTTRARRS